ncbi:hypothetical protein [Acidaminococcus fermentans]|uniref:hypothetical protein n=1 Tax=Acidaminococcus fermentans TaxID=905 RepID=UPI00242B6135|nr:hypothetical protein [Acidaminococcus fermentans]
MGMTAKSGYAMTKKLESLMEILTVGALASTKVKSKITGYEVEVPSMVRREFRV